MKRLILPLIAVVVCGCTSLTVEEPANGSTTASLPQQIRIKETVGIDGSTQGQNKLTVDGQELEVFSNVSYSVPPGSVLCCLQPGTHTVAVSGHTASSGTITNSSSFTVAACPGCYSGCPSNGFVHPVVGVCCDNGKCDILAASNFGPWRFPAAALCPASTWANDCLNQNANSICGRDGAGCANIANMATQMMAVSFKPQQNGALRQIHVPIGFRNGANAFQAWITSDVGGSPGTALETFPLPNLRMQPFPTRSAVHIFSIAHPNLTAGTTYWLVIGPTAATAVGSWNYSVYEAAAAGSTDFKVNSTPNSAGVPQLSGPWVPANGLRRTAFEIDIR